MESERARSLQTIAETFEATEPIVAKAMERCRSHCKTLQAGISKFLEDGWTNYHRDFEKNNIIGLSSHSETLQEYMSNYFLIFLLNV